MLRDLASVNLNDAENLPLLEKAARRVVEHDLPDEAAKFWHHLKIALPTVTNPTLQARYRGVAEDLSWLILPILPEAERFELLRNSFLRAVRIGANLEGVFTRLVYTIPPMVWPEEAPRYLQALRENREPLGPQRLGEYLGEFNRALPDRRPTELDVLRYFERSEASKKLSPEDKALLQQALHYYIGLAPLTLAEVSQYVTPEERSAFEAALEAPPVPAAPPLPPAAEPFYSAPESRPSLRSQLFAPPISAPPEPPPPPVPKPQPDPYLPHRPKPVPTLEGSTIRLRREALVMAPQPSSPQNPPEAPPPQRAKPAPPPPKPLRPSTPPAAAPSVAGSKAPPPQNLPVVKPTHNEGPELVARESSVAPLAPQHQNSAGFVASSASPHHDDGGIEPDPYLPHKPKPIPRLSGNLVDLKRKPIE